MRKEPLVVIRVLGEGRELTECRVHRPRPRIQSCVMCARGLVDSLRIRRELVVEPVEEDLLASFHQTLDVRSTEVEMPD